MGPETIRWCIWGALAGAVGLYAALAAVLIPAGDAPGASPIPSIAFAAAALGLGVASLAVRAVGIGLPLRRGTLDPADPAGAGRTTAMLVVSWALAEAVAILGLVLALLSGDARPAYGLAAASLVLLVLLAPRGLRRAPASAAELARPDVRIGTP